MKKVLTVLKAATKHTLTKYAQALIFGQYFL